MQADLDDLAAEIPHPVATRTVSAVRSAAGSVVGAGRSLLGFGGTVQPAPHPSVSDRSSRRSR